MQNFTKNSFSLFLQFPQFLSSKYILNKSYLTEIINEVSIKNKSIYRAIEENVKLLNMKSSTSIVNYLKDNIEDR